MNLNKMKTNNMKTTKIINENQENILEDFKKIIKFSKARYSVLSICAVQNLS